jgi:WD40 repeat protein
VVSGSRDKTLRVWNVDTGSCERVLEGHTDVSGIIHLSLFHSFLIFHELVTSVSVLPDGQVLSGSQDNTPRVWNVDTGSCEGVLEDSLTEDVSSATTLPHLLPYLDGYIPPPGLFTDLPFCQVIGMKNQTLILHKIGANISIPSPPTSALPNPSHGV